MNKSPMDESPDPVPDVSVKRMAPVAPINIPVMRLHVMASFRMKKDRSTTSIGLIVIIIPVFTGEVRLSP